MRLPALVLLAAGMLISAPPADRGKVLHVPAWATPRNEADAPPLDPKLLTAKINGADVPVTAVRGPADDMVLMLVLDLSEDLSLADLAKDAMVSAVEGLPPKVNVAVLRAQDELGVLLDPTANREAVTGVIRGLSVSGKAGLLESVAPTERIADAMLDKAAVRVAVLYVTDSNIRNYREDYVNPVINSSDEHDMSRRFPDALIREKISKLESKLAPFASPLFIVQIAYRGDSLNDAYQTGLLRLIPNWGGSSAVCRSRAEVSESILSAFRNAVAHYSVSLRLPERKSKALQVQLEAPGYSLSYRNRFVVE